MGGAALPYSPTAWVGLAICSALVACGGQSLPRGPRESELRGIADSRALEMITEVLREAGIGTATGWQIDVGGSAPFAADVRLANTDFGIEWVTAQDRAEHGTLIPEADPNGQLRILPGAGEDARCQVLVLDHRNYRWDPDLERVERGSVGVREAEGRLRRDVQDFVEYVRGQGAL